MARYIYQGTYKNGSGKVVTSGTISVFEADGTTAASVYTAQSGGSAVNSVTSDSTDGSFVFYVDDGDYTTSQKFKITLSKTDYKSKSYDDINIFPQVSLAGTETLTSKTLTTPVIASIYQDAGKTKLMTVPNTASDTLVTLDATQTLTAKTLTTPTLTVPVISSMASATHDHVNAAGGGNLGAVQATDVTVTASAASPPDTNTLTKESLIKGWVTFDGTSGSIYAGATYFNVSGITDNGTGDYTVTWDTDFADVNYAVIITTKYDTSGNVGGSAISAVASNPAVGSVRINTFNMSGTLVDVVQVHVIAMGNQ